MLLLETILFPGLVFLGARIVFVRFTIFPRFKENVSVGLLCRLRSDVGALWSVLFQLPFHNVVEHKEMERRPLSRFCFEVSSPWKPAWNTVRKKRAAHTQRCPRCSKTFWNRPICLDQLKRATSRWPKSALWPVNTCGTTLSLAGTTFQFIVPWRRFVQNFGSKHYVVKKLEDACVGHAVGVGYLLERIGSKEKPVQYLEMLERFFVGTRPHGHGHQHFWYFWLPISITWQLTTGRYQKSVPGLEHWEKLYGTRGNHRLHFRHPHLSIAFNQRNSTSILASTYSLLMAVDLHKFKLVEGPSSVESNFK